MAEPFRAQLTTKIDTSILFCVVSSSQKADVYLLGWQSVVDGHMDFMEAESLKDAKKEMIDVLDNHCTDQINYYKELQDSLSEIN